MSKQELSTLSLHVATILPQSLIDDLRTLIDQTKEAIAATVNSLLSMLYWHVGSRIPSEILNNERVNTAVKLSLLCHDNWLKIMVRVLRTRTCVA